MFDSRDEILCIWIKLKKPRITMKHTKTAQNTMI
jgi:hypothetical protein